MDRPLQLLNDAWSELAPNRAKEALFPRGFWPDLAFIAVHRALGIDLPEGFRPTMCSKGDMPEPEKKSVNVDDLLSELGI